jgi:predicted PurR-regulated permease PerM
LLAGVLVGLVFQFRVKHNGAAFENLQLANTEDEPGIYYININATFLVFIASWSSSLAPLLAGFILALALYPISRKYLEEARAGRSQNLLTPYQLALTLRFLNGGGFGALWSWLEYLARWKDKRESQASPLTSTVSVTILAISLGYVVSVILGSS